MIAAHRRAAGRKRAELPYNVGRYRLRENAGYLITRARGVLWDAADRALAPLNMTLSQWIVIANLHDNTGVTPAEICKLLAYDRGAMTRLLDRLEKKGFVRRVRRAADRRSVALMLTAAGRALYPKMLAALVDALNETFADFRAREVRQLETLLMRLVHAGGANAGQR